jgi:tRNA pseudouridine38-40 synthase
MPTLKLTIEYDGTDFAGWQLQPGCRTVQGEIEQALERVVGTPIRITGAGRTDAGVHARGQVASFQVERVLPLSAYTRGLGALLPRDVSVVAAEVADDGFDARRSASGKRYVYQISNRALRSPLLRRTHWEIFGRLDGEAMARACAHLVGERDFACFRAANCPAKTTVRRMDRAELRHDGDELVFTVEATAFLKQMVRAIVGTLVEVGQGKRDPDSIPALLASRDRTKAGMTAPAQGLTLDEVFYGPRR